MNKKETWYLLAGLVIAGLILYFVETSNATNPATPAGATPTLGPVWTIAENTVQSVRFEDMQTGLFVELENNAGKWVMAKYSLVTPTLTPTITGTPTLKPSATATLGSDVTPTLTLTPTATATATNTETPTATLEVSLTPSLVPTQEADVQSWPYMLEYLRALQPVQSIGDNLKPEDFGLTTPRYKLTMQMTDGKTAILLIGASAPVKSAGYYAQVSGTQNIFLLEAGLVDTLIGYLTHPPVAPTATSAVTNTATVAPTATSLPTLTPTATIAAPTETPAETATAS
jgi:hypothetical protein